MKQLVGPRQNSGGVFERMVLYCVRPQEFYGPRTAFGSLDN